MAISAEQLNIILSARDKEFQRKMRDAERRVQHFKNQSNKNLSSTTKHFSALSKAAAGFLPALSAGVLIQQTRRVVAELDAIGKKADQIGITTDALQELRSVAESAGVSQGSLDSSLERFSKRLGEAEMGMGAAKRALEELNLSASELNDMGLDAALSVIADKMSLITDPTERAALAAALFGREGVAMVNLLREGSEGMDRMRKQARELGIVVDEELIRSAEDAQTQLDLMSRVINANLSTALISLAPLLVGTAEKVASLSRGIANFISQAQRLASGENLLSSDYQDQLIAEADAMGLYTAEVEALRQARENAANVPPSRFAAGGGLSQEVADAALALERALSSADQPDDTGNGAAAARAALAIIERQTEQLNEQARLNRMSAEDAERQRISREKERMVAEALSSITGDSFSVEATAARLEAERLGEEYEKAAIAASTILNPVASASAATKKLADGAEEAEKSFAELFEELSEGNPILTQLGFTAESLESTMNVVQRSMENAFMSMIDGTATAEEAFRAMARDIIKELFRVLVVQRLVGAFAPGGGGLMGSIYSAVSGRASGGSVMAGKPYMVGEHGREPFIPSENGRILSTAQAKDALSGGGGGVIVNQTINVSTGVQQTVRTEIKSMLPMIADASKAAVADAKRRGEMGFA